MKKWKCEKSKIILDTKFFKVRQDLVQLPSKKKIDWTYWDSKDSVMVLGMTKGNKLVMIRQYRYLVNDEVIEFPSGRIHDNENSIKGAAKREFEEEAGYKCEKLIKLGAFYETYGQLNRQIYLFFSKNIVKTKQNLDFADRGYEDIKVELVDFEKVVRLALENRIVAMGSSLAILLLREKIARKQIKI